MKRKVLFNIILVLLVITLLPIISFAADMTKTGSMSVKNKNVKAGEKVYVELQAGYYVGCVIKVNIKDHVNNVTKIVELNNVTNNPYFVMPSDAKPGSTYIVESYEITDNAVGDVNLDGKRTNEDYESLFKYLADYPLEDCGMTEESLKRLDVNKDGQVNMRDLTKLYQVVLSQDPTSGMNIHVPVVEYENNAKDSLIYVRDEELEKITLDSIAIKGNNKITKNDKLYLDIKMTGANDITYMSVFISKANKNEQIKLVIEDYKTNAYIDLSKVKDKLSNGEYKITDVFIEANGKKIRYTNTSTSTETFRLLQSNPLFSIVSGNINGNTTPVNTNENTTSNNITNTTNETQNTSSDNVTKEEVVNVEPFDNEKNTNEIIKQINKIEEKTVIEIDANNNSIIKSDLFEAITNTNKTLKVKSGGVEWIFNGEDIEQPKDIDVSINVYNLQNNEKISKMVNKGFVLEFAKNGKLPGKCLIRIQADAEIKEIMNNGDASIYYYNENTNNFDVVALRTKLTENNCYEFYINKNSKYIMTPEEIDEQYIVGNTVETSGIIENEKPLTENIKKVDVTLIIQISIIVACIVILVLIFKGVILSNKNKKK